MSFTCGPPNKVARALNGNIATRWIGITDTLHTSEHHLRRTLIFFSLPFWKIRKNPQKQQGFFLAGEPPKTLEKKQKKTQKSKDFLEMKKQGNPERQGKKDLRRRGGGPVELGEARSLADGRSVLRVDMMPVR